MAAIVDRLRGIAEKVGARATGATVQDVLSDIEVKLANNAAPQQKAYNKPQKKAEKPFFTDDKTDVKTDEN